MCDLRLSSSLRNDVTEFFVGNTQQSLIIATVLLCCGCCRATNGNMSPFARGWVGITGESCHKYLFCCDKSFVATNNVFVTTKHVFCRDKSICMRVATNLILLQQTRVCRDKTHLLSRQKYACRDACLSRQIFVVKKIFVASNLILSRQKYFCRDKRRILSRQTCVFATKKEEDTCGSSRQ